MKIFPEPIKVNLRNLFSIVLISICATASEAMALTALMRHFLGLEDSPSQGTNALTTDSQSGFLFLSGPGANGPLLALLAIALLSASTGFHLLLGRTISQETERIVSKVRLDLTSAVLRSSYESYRADSRDTDFFVVSTTRQLGSGIQGTLTGITHLVMMGGFLVACVFVSPRASAGILLVILAVFALIVPVVRSIRTAAQAAEQAEERFSSELSALNAVFAEIKIHGLTEPAIGRVSRRIATARDRRRRLGQLTFSSSLAYRDVALILFALLLLLLAQLDRSLTSGLASAGVLGLRALASAHSVNLGRNARGALRASCTELESVRQRRAYSPTYKAAVPTSGDTFRAEGSTARVEITDLKFSFDHSGPIFTPLNAFLEGPSLVGVTGPSGAGKTTLLELLCGLRAPSSGRIVVNSIIPTEISEEVRRGLFSVSLQQTSLLPGSIRDNLDFLGECRSDNEMRDALQVVGLWNELDLDSSGLDAPIGVGANLLSGGQRQRFGIARAAINPRPVMIFDEPTSALDLENGERITDLVISLSKSSLVIVISHDPHFLSHFDHELRIEARHP